MGRKSKGPLPSRPLKNHIWTKRRQRENAECPKATNSNDKPVPEHAISMSRDITWSRLGDLNPGPTHYETAPTHGFAPKSCCLSTTFVTPSNTQTHRVTRRKGDGKGEHSCVDSGWLPHGPTHHRCLAASWPTQSRTRTPQGSVALTDRPVLVRVAG